MSKWVPKQTDYSSIFSSQNPWQQIGTVPEELAPLTYRPLAEVLWNVLLSGGSRRHQIILGPRRVGKTTTMYQTVRELINNGVPPNKLWWLRLDHPLLISWDLGELVSQIIKVSNATPENPTYIFLDELTYALKWDLWLKTFFDEQWPVRIIGTSSATAALRQQGTESGVGRWEEQFLAPYLFTEYLTLRGVPTDFAVQNTLHASLAHAVAHPPSKEGETAQLRRRFILTGGFPELLLDSKADKDEASSILKSQRVLRSDAIEKSIYKDLPQAFSIRDPAKLERLLYILAGQITGIFSPNTIAGDLGLAPKTLDTYATFLERAFLIFTLNNYAASEETVQRRGKKLYFMDAAIRNAALLRGIAPLNDSAEMGLLIENMAASHLRALAHQEGVRLYHWRNNNNEIDLVYDHPDAPVAFEITVSRSHTERGIRSFQERFPRFREKCYLVSMNATPRAPQGDTPGVISLDDLLIVVGRQEHKALQDRIGGTGPTRSRDGQLLLF